MLALRPLPPRRSNRRVRMDVFEFRERLVGEYSQFTRSFARIRSADIASFVAAAYESQRYWPAPLVQVNPNFRSGHSVDQLVAAGSLHAECARIFRAGKGAASAGTSLQLFKHQEEAIGFAQTGASYVLTTGTGSIRQELDIPEPGTLAILGLGLLRMVDSRRKQ